MQPSSLIFVAIVAIWAAFLVQHWVRRREALATARSVDRFSAAIRLLDQEYAALGSPLAARPHRPARTGPSSGPAVPRQRVRRPVSRLAHWGRRVRGLSFLGLLALVPITIGLSALSVLRWTSVLVSVLSLALGLVMLRYAAVHERTLRRVERSLAAAGRSAPTIPGAAARRVARPDARPAPRRAASRPESKGPEARPVPVATSAPALVVGPAAAAGDRGAGLEGAPLLNAAVAEPDGTLVPTAPARATSSAQPRASRRAAYAAYTADGTWQPVAVPPPTYTLKAKVERPQPTPAEVTVTPAPVAHEQAEAAAAAEDTAPARAVGD